MVLHYILHTQSCSDFQCFPHIRMTPKTLKRLKNIVLLLHIFVKKPFCIIGQSLRPRVSWCHRGAIHDLVYDIPYAINLLRIVDPTAFVLFNTFYIDKDQSRVLRPVDPLSCRKFTCVFALSIIEA